MTVPGQILDRPNLDRTIPRHGHILEISTKQYFLTNFSFNGVG